MLISDWSSDVCSSDLRIGIHRRPYLVAVWLFAGHPHLQPAGHGGGRYATGLAVNGLRQRGLSADLPCRVGYGKTRIQYGFSLVILRSEEHTSELQSLMRISYAVFCLKKKNKHTNHDNEAGY